MAQAVFKAVFPSEVASNVAKLRVLQAHISTMPDQAVDDLPSVFTNPQLDSTTDDSTSTQGTEPSDALQAQDLNVKITDKFLKRGASFHAVVTVDLVPSCCTILVCLAC